MTAFPNDRDIDYKTIAESSERFDDSPEEAKKWLKSFGDFKHGTDFSIHLKSREVSARSETGDSLSTSHSLLPTLARWLRKWHERLMYARRQQKEEARKRGGNASGTVPLEEQKDFDWLSQYICQYLELEHHLLPSDDIGDLSEVLIGICHTTNQLKDIETAVSIWHALLLKWPLPSAKLYITLKLLCQVRALYGETTSGNLVDCVRLLIQGEYQSDVLVALYQLAEPDVGATGKDALMGMRAARGSLAFMRRLLDVTSSNGQFLLPFDRTISLLFKESQHRMIKLSIEILPLCGALLSQEERCDDSFKHDWGKMMELLIVSARPFTPESMNVTVVEDATSMTAPSSDVDFSKDVRNHSKAAQDLNDILARLLNAAPRPKAKMLYDYLLTYPMNLLAPASLLILQYAGDQNLCQPQYPQSLQEAEQLLKIFVINPTHPAEVRCRAAEVVRETFEAANIVRANSNPPELEKADDAASGLRKLFFSQILSEMDPYVFNVLLRSLQSTALSETESGTLMAHLDSRLSEQRLKEPNFTEFAEISTKALIRIFLSTMVSIPDVAKSAFETLIKVSMFKDCPSKIRISAMKFLFALRCDLHGSIYIKKTLESEYIAAALCRTRDSAEAFAADESTSARDSGSTKSVGQSSESQAAVWMYPDLELADAFASGQRSQLVARGLSKSQEYFELDTGFWLLSLIQCFQKEVNWEVYSFIVVHLGAQLGNVELFQGSLPTVIKLRQILCDQIRESSFLEPPMHTGLKRSDVAICLFNVLTPLIAYGTMKSEIIEKAFGDDLVRTFLYGVGGPFEGTARGCIHALSICALELPASLASQYPAIIDKLSKSMTQPHLTMDILEFLSQVARLPQVHSNFREEEITMIFGICIQFLEKAREQNIASATSPQAKTTMVQRHSYAGMRRPPYRQAMLQNVGFPQYAAALAYHTMIWWFLSLKLEIRGRYVAWIVPRLVWKNPQGEEMLAEQSQVFIDMMQRAAFSDLGETRPEPGFAKADDGKVSSASWIVGLSVITAETAGHSGRTQITKRQASGTTFALYRQSTADLPRHHAPSNTEIHAEEEGAFSTEMLPAHVLLQLVTTAAPTNVGDQPVQLPKEDFVVRALSSFDRLPTVDNHKFGILFIDENQNAEDDYLANTKGSKDYLEFLHNIGYSVSLRPPLTFNPSGLEYPRDGDTTIAWRDRIAELVYLIPTMMPTNLEDDPHSNAKKMHVGNCHVNIIFNHSGLEWKFENFRSQLNYVNIVITPATVHPLSPGEQLIFAEYNPGSLPPPQASFYKVHLLNRPDLPPISPAADPKIVSSSQLAPFVRMIALNADVFCHAWNAKQMGDTEFPSSWRARLQEIKRLKERTLAWKTNKEKETVMVTARTSRGDGVSGRRNTQQQTSAAGDTKELARQLDFSRWTLG